MKNSKKAYEEWLNEQSEDMNVDDWIIGGVARMYYKAKGEYGTAVRKHDPTLFEIGHREWKGIK